MTGLGGGDGERGQQEGPAEVGCHVLWGGRDPPVAVSDPGAGGDAVGAVNGVEARGLLARLLWGVDSARAGPGQWPRSSPGNLQAWASQTHCPAGPWPAATSTAPHPPTGSLGAAGSRPARCTGAISPAGLPAPHWGAGQQAVEGCGSHAYVYAALISCQGWHLPSCS